MPMKFSRRGLLRPGVRALGALFAVVSLLATPARAAVHSDVDGILIARLNALPEATTEANACLNDWPVPTTVAGKAVAAAGWKVTSEVSKDGYTLVGMYSSAKQGSSGSCFADDGNVAIFRGEQLQAMVYAPPPINDQPSPVALVTDAGVAHTVRLWSSFGVLGPSADLRLDQQGAKVVEVAASEPVCGGRAQVPNIYARQIRQARKQLLDAGWRPRLAESIDAYDRAGELAASGVPEVQACSGTGFGFCSFSYGRVDGAQLGVITVGDDYRVSSYSVTCAKGDGK